MPFRPFAGGPSEASLVHQLFHCVNGALRMQGVQTDPSVASDHGTSVSCAGPPSAVRDLRQLCGTSVSCAEVPHAVRRSRTACGGPARCAEVPHAVRRSCRRLCLGGRVWCSFRVLIQQSGGPCRNRVQCGWNHLRSGSGYWVVGRIDKSSRSNKLNCAQSTRIRCSWTRPEANIFSPGRVTIEFIYSPVILGREPWTGRN